jgi:hypothetical protein
VVIGGGGVDRDPPHQRRSSIVCTVKTGVNVGSKCALAKIGVCVFHTTAAG